MVAEPGTAWRGLSAGHGGIRAAIQTCHNDNCGNQIMKQHCHLAFIYLAWVTYLGGLAWLLWRGQYLVALFWLVLTPLVQWWYLRAFPRISSLMGYGRVDDQKASTVSQAAVRVTLYTALGCPFCPLIEQRLEALQKSMGFSLEKIDVTLRPGLLASQGIRSVPVVEVGERRLTGLATTSQLAAAILGKPA
jgi:glutaredoxin